MSVIIPTYNRARTIARSIESVFAQSFQDFELILVDDCSKDNTAEIVRKWQSDPRFRYIRHESNRGAAGARNTAIRAARTDYIAFLDSDDSWLPDKLNLQMQLLDKLGPAFGVVTGTMLRPQPGGGVMHCPWRYTLGADGVREVTFNHIAEQLFAHVQTILVRRSDLEACGLIDEQLRASDDWDLLLRLARQTRIADCGQPVTVAYYSTDRLTGRPELVIADMTRILAKQASWLPPRVAAHVAYIAALAACESGRFAQARALAAQACVGDASHRRAKFLRVVLSISPTLARALVSAVRRLRVWHRIAATAVAVRLPSSLFRGVRTY
ncbi:MAG: glycosyltransferase family 2 protein [Nevskiales bacterium]